MRENGSTHATWMTHLETKHFVTWSQYRRRLYLPCVLVVFTGLPSRNLSIHPNNWMDSKRKLSIVIMNRIAQPEIFCEDLLWDEDQQWNGPFVLRVFPLWYKFMMSHCKNNFNDVLFPKHWKVLWFVISFSLTGTKTLESMGLLSSWVGVRNN